MNSSTLTQKQFATAQAEAAMARASLLQIEGDNGKPVLVLTREAMTAQLNNLNQVRCVLADLANEVEAANV